MSRPAGAVSGVSQGRHWARTPEPPEFSGIRDAATSALWGANGTLAACAVAALVLAAQQGPEGRLADPGVFRPSYVAPEAPADGAGNAAIPETASVASQASPGAGSGRGGNARQQLVGEAGISVAASWVALPGAGTAAGTAPAAGGSVAGAATVPTAAQRGTTAPTAQPQAPSPVGTTPSGSSGEPVGSPAAPADTDPAPADEGPAPEVVEPVTQPVQPVVEEVPEAVTRAVEPVTQAVETVTRAVEPVTRAAEPVTRAVEPVTQAVPQAVEQVTKALPEAADLEVPGGGSLPVPLG
jgi:hypothetical protein